MDGTTERGLQVIGAGFPRTGSTSMKAALDRLGFGPCHHMFEIASNPEQVDRWLPVVNDPDIDWGSVLLGYRSSTDWPSGHFWRELAATYPEAKVILTVRDPQQWYRSFVELTAGVASPGAASQNGMAATMRRMRPVLSLIERAHFGAELQPGRPVDQDVAITAYERHVEQVRSEVAPDRLLVFDVRTGWEPLCAFLGVPVPADEPFPHLNDSAFLQKVAADGQISSPFA